MQIEYRYSTDDLYGISFLYQAI